jgi:hypothetical protein
MNRANLLLVLLLAADVHAASAVDSIASEYMAPESVLPNCHYLRWADNIANREEPNNPGYDSTDEPFPIRPGEWTECMEKGKTLLFRQTINGSIRDDYNITRGVVAMKI